METATLSTGDNRAATAFQNEINALIDRPDLPAEGKALIVNVPQFELIAVEEGCPVFRSRVIVGAPSNPTPIIDTATSRVTFRPTWRPTPEMIASGAYADRVRSPGPSNPLGLAAGRLEPGLLVCLQDTNQRQLLERDDRALSHGCIPVQRRDEVIAWLLGRDLARVHAVAGGRATVEVPAPSVPVFIRYMTVFPDAEGTLLRYPDIYGREAAMPRGPRLSTAGSAPGCPDPRHRDG